ncbi:MAG: flagellar biosynthesis anti-sigma factor FlgM [Bradyrhizobium sp.]|uniref:flagellar biosynthesis anti-sigma factor FlgM n=1 Tax=Bradyrhizobium sp. TaxID=376 RepID=UPI003D0AA176
MPIEITGHTTAQTGTAHEGASVRGARSGTATDPKTGGGAAAGALDTLSLTDTGTLLQKLDAAIAATPVVDMARVNRIQQAIENGSYEIDPARVAEKMLAFETALQSRGL